MRRQFHIALMVFTLALTGAVAPLPAGNGATIIQQMFVIKELKPAVERVGIMLDPNVSSVEKLMPQIQRAGASTGVKVFLTEVKDLKDVAPRYRKLIRDHEIQALLIVNGEGVMGNPIARSFLIKNATTASIPVFAPDADWINEGASVSITKVNGSISLLVNRAAASATALQIPEKYLERTEYLAVN